MRLIGETPEAGASHRSVQSVSELCVCGFPVSRIPPLTSPVCAIPKHAILTPRTAAFSQIIPFKADLDEAGVLLYLTACVLYELCLGQQSKWFDYLQILPRDVIQIPSLWEYEPVGGRDGREALRLLKGTEAQRELTRKSQEGLSLVSQKGDSIKQAEPFGEFLSWVFIGAEPRAQPLDSRRIPLRVLSLVDSSTHRGRLPPHRPRLVLRPIQPFC